MSISAPHFRRTQRDGERLRYWCVMLLAVLAATGLIVGIDRCSYRPPPMDVEEQAKP
jgi:hypothetical protein